MERTQAFVGKRVIAHIKDTAFNEETGQLDWFEQDVECVIRELGRLSDKDRCLLRIVGSVPREVRIGWKNYSDLKEVEHV